MNKRDMKKEMYWAILSNVFSEQHASDALVKNAIENLQPNGVLTEAGERRYEQLVVEIMGELRRKAGE